MKTNYLFIVLSATALAVPSQAALTVTDGGFELGGNAQADTSFATSVANWSESTPGGFQEFVYNHSGEFSSGNTKVALDRPSSYLYQNIGTRAVGEDLVSITFDAFKRDGGANRTFGDVQFTILSGVPTTIGDGTDILADIFLTNHGSVTVTAADLGFNDANPNLAEQNLGFTTTSINITSAGVGDAMWLYISSPSAASGTGGSNEPFLDNIAVSATAVPEPSSALLCGLAGIGCLIRRRRSSYR